MISRKTSISAKSRSMSSSMRCAQTQQRAQKPVRDRRTESNAHSTRGRQQARTRACVRECSVTKRWPRSIEQRNQMPAEGSIARSSHQVRAAVEDHRDVHDGPHQSHRHAHLRSKAEGQVSPSQASCMQTVRARRLRQASERLSRIADTRQQRTGRNDEHDMTRHNTATRTQGRPRQQRIQATRRR